MFFPLRDMKNGSSYTLRPKESLKNNFFSFNENIIFINCGETGFFSQSTILLWSIIVYINKFNKIPNIIDTSLLFSWYKTENETNIILNYFDFPYLPLPATKNESSSTLRSKYLNHFNMKNVNLPTIQSNKNVTTMTNLINSSEQSVKYLFNKLFENPSSIFFNPGTQFSNYQNINYNKIVPIINFFFSPSLKITNIIKDITSKYSVDYENTCVLFYRGNDKITETPLSGYNEYIQYSQEIYQKNPNIKFLIQSDETEFINFFTNLYPKNSFYFKDEIRHINKQNNTVDKVFKDKNSLYSKYYLAITIIMSKCKYIICGSGNCSIWIMLYRGNCSNVCQYLNGEWISNLLH